MTSIYVKPIGSVIRNRLFAFIGAFAVATSSVWACEACNMQFAKEVAGHRSESLVGRELQSAMRNQQGLPLNELKANYLLQQERELPSESRDETPVRSREVQTVKQVDSGERYSGEEAQLLANNTLENQSTAVSREVQGQAGRSNPSRELPEYFEGAEFIEVIRRDYGLPIPPTSAVPQDAPADKTFTIELGEGKTYLGNGVLYDGFLTNGKVPGPTFIVDEGDIVEFVVENKGAIPHGASIHAANTQTSKYLGKIGPGQTARVKFKAAQPGVYMYHCAPGGHAIPMHVLFGQYGMIVVKPREKYELERVLGHEPDLELYLIQNEIYASGKDAVDGNPAYVTFNGRIFRYIEDPIQVKPGDFVRIYFLNIGPNLLSTFHIVGIIWDYAYWQGHPQARVPGGQTVTAGPSDSWVIEFRVPPDEGAYTMLSHAVGSTSKGAIGLMVADRNAKTQTPILAEGPEYSEQELKEFEEKAMRVVSPFHIGTHPVDQPVVYGPEVKEVHVSIVGNSFHPKVIQIAPGTKVTWTNEDVFAYLAGEFSGIHNVASLDAPPNADNVISDLLAHGESFSHVFEEEWEYDYICTPHPYMKGRVVVQHPEYVLAGAGGLSDGATAAQGGRLQDWIIGLLALCFVVSTLALARSGEISRRRNP